MGCEGPLVWFDAAGGGAVLECADQSCDYFITTGSLHNKEHAHTDLLRGGLA